MPVEIALLREPSLADQTAEPALDTALVVLVPPERREEGVGLVAFVADVLHLGPDRHGVVTAVVDAPPRQLKLSLRPLLLLLLIMITIAIVDTVAYEGRPIGQHLAAVGAEVASHDG